MISNGEIENQFMNSVKLENPENYACRKDETFSAGIVCIIIERDNVGWFNSYCHKIGIEIHGQTEIYFKESESI